MVFTEGVINSERKTEKERERERERVKVSLRSFDFNKRGAIKGESSSDSLIRGGFGGGLSLIDGPRVCDKTKGFSSR